MRFVLPGGGNRNQKFRREWNWKTWSWNERFPLLSLPDEMISYIFSFLPIKDRLRARMNKRLDKIELDTECRLGTLLIKEISINDPLPIMQENDQCIIFYEERSYSSDCIKRIMRNVYPEDMFLSISGSKNFHIELFHLIANFAERIIELTIEIDNDKMKRLIMNDDYLLELARNVCWLRIQLSDHMLDNITPEALYEVYEILLSDSEESPGIDWMDIRIDEIQCISFLNLIGITNKEGKFFSSRNGLEVYRLRNTDDSQEYHIFDGNLQMQFDWEWIEWWMHREMYDEDHEFDDIDRVEFLVFFRRHSTTEALEDAKKTKGFEKLDDFFSSE